MKSYEEFVSLVKISGPKMVPFLKAVCVYFILNAHNQHGEYWTTILKCVPIIGLIIFILLYGISITSRSSYMHKILVALKFSCLGDALLNHNHFVYGMCAFSVTQIFYIMAFGFRPLKLWIGAFLYTVGAAIVFMLSSRLDSVLLIGLPIYTVLLVTMCWRAIALLFMEENSRNILKIVCAIASVLFVMSDTMIAIDKFHTPIKNSSVWIMGTYYAAQCGISLSVVDVNKFKRN